ncbi:hypothetical protein B0A50_03668 [Salinomyces thailandicus]|uniref:Heme oxygenase-like protein n=1 Tax=Salinomyces thailandicus TaxID=706561 RepID=A0A4U0U2N8_9PEZI|nr:hypothetical protein B0A50_03668 [Salinomyces thailandica]
MAEPQELPLPTPAPSPPPEPATRPSISAEINKATRKHHTELNRLIIDRLPLALPPHTPIPDLLGQGLATFAHIFFAFEDIWQDIEDGTHRLSKYDPDQAHAYDVVSSLAFLRPMGLVRSERLRKDLEAISTRVGRDVLLKDAVGRHVEGRVREQVDRHPWLLVAYAWVMYMAIFSGGRWIRQQFANAGPEFWTGQEAAVVAGILDEKKKLQLPGFSFLSFDSAEDGEDMKAEFKSRLADTEALLTDTERQEVVDAAQGLFEECIALVGELDLAVAKRKTASIALPAVVLTLLLLLMVWLYWFDNYVYAGR